MDRSVCGSECVSDRLRGFESSVTRAIFGVRGDLRCKRVCTLASAVAIFGAGQFSPFFFFFFLEFCGRSGAGAGATVLVSLGRE